MKVYLEAALAGQRRGRFLQGLLAAATCDNLPSSGCLLMLGEDFQQHPQETLLAWAKQPERVLLLLPPYQEGMLSDTLDWQISFSSQPPSALNGLLPSLLAAETLFTLQGKQGGFNPELGHEWADHAINTRYWKTHSNSGMLAATVLPLWSISLLDKAEELQDWLSGLMQLAGKAATAPDTPAEQPAPALLPQDYSVLVCCYGWQLATPTSLQQHLQEASFPLLDFRGVDMEQSFARLSQTGLLDKVGITTAGIAILQASPYWPYAAYLKEAQ